MLDNISGSLAPPLADELLKADIHTSMLRFLNQSDRSVSDVLGRVVAVDEAIKLPYYWVGILGLLVQDGFSVDAQEEARLAVAKGIEPFVASVMDDKRELFRSNHVWHLCVTPFFELMREVMKSKDAFIVMVSYDGFLPFVAQASCWSQSRPDIVQECKLLRRRRRDPMTNPGTTLEVCERAQHLIALLMWEHEDDLDEDERRGALDQIASTPLSSDCADDSTIVGLIRMMSETDEEHAIVLSLLLTYEYVDARVIAELVQYGRGNQSMGAAETVLYTMQTLLGLDADYDHIEQIDSRYGAAIRHGLLEFCIDALVAYGDQSDCEIGDGLGYLAGGVYAMAMHSETSRALRERNVDIVTALDALRKKFASQFNEICVRINDAVGMSAPFTCCNCLKEVDRKKLLFCKRCGVECYCSLACQSESYVLGHDELCKEEVEIIDGLRDDGLSETELKRVVVLKSNLMMNGCRLVREKAARFLDEEQHDIEIDFDECPPLVEVTKSDEETSDSVVKFIFTKSVYYGFADRVDDMEVVDVEKVISRRMFAEPSAGARVDLQN